MNQGVKIPGTTIASNLYRMGITSSSTSNRLAYLGKKSRSFTIAASVAFEASSSPGNTDYIFYFQRFNAAGLLVARIISSESFIDANSGCIQNIPILANVQMNSGDYIELFSERILGNDRSITIRSVTVSMQ